MEDFLYQKINELENEIEKTQVKYRLVEIDDILKRVPYVDENDPLVYALLLKYRPDLSLDERALIYQVIANLNRLKEAELSHFNLTSPNST